MKNAMLVILALGLALGLGCSRDDAEKAAASAREGAEAVADSAQETADAAADVAAQAGDAAAAEAVEGAAADAGEAVQEASAAVATDAVAACRSFAEKAAWDQALAVCEKAHELLPDDLAIEHALQQAKVAAE